MYNSQHPVSFLYTPLTMIDHIFKSHEVGADVGVFDLEDSIPDNKKAVSRSLLHKCLSNPNFLPLKAVRINSIRCKFGLEDVLFFLENKIIPDIIILSMVESKDEISILKELLIENQPLIKIYAIIETPKALHKIREIASVCDGLIFGSADLSTFLHVPITWENMLHARYSIAHTAAEYGIDAIDTACYILDSENVLEDECRKVKELGFHGKSAIHPKQVAIINKIFYPNKSELDYATKIIEKSTQQDAPVFAFDGKMIGPPFIKKAKEIVNRFGQYCKI